MAIGLWAGLILGLYITWRAIEILDGNVVNPAILAFQNRSAEAPYAVG